MKNVLIAGMIIGLVLAAAGTPAAPADIISLASPPDRSYVESEVIGVIVNGWPTMIDEITITVNGRRQNLPARPFRRFVMCYDGIHLSYGMNEIVVTGLWQKRTVQQRTVHVFRRSDLSEDAVSAPDGFGKFVFHTDESEKGCQSCHQFDFDEAETVPGKSPCAVCHTRMLNDYPNVHGPAAYGDCLMCHDARSRNPKLAAAKPIGKTCLGCHELDWEKKKYRHAPTATGACTICHNPHASEERYFLRAGTVTLCASCHAEILTRPHVVSSFSNNSGHPLQNRRDPLQPDRSLTCASCHNPHGENSRKFLNNYDESQSLHLFCLTCHRFK